MNRQLDKEKKYYQKKVSDHRGYDIIYYMNYRRATEYYYISKSGERVSPLCLSSPKACINVINTFLRANNQ